MNNPKHVLIIVNPVSGPGVTTDRSKKIAELARSLGWNGTIEETSIDRNAGIIASEGIKRGIRHVIACGGDGTIMEVLAAAVKKKVVVGIVPIGTGNLFAQNLAIPTALDEALQTALFGHPITVDVGQANGVYFSIIAGMGLDADMIKKADRNLKNKFGIFAYIFALIQSLRRPAGLYRIIINNHDEKVVRAKSIIVANMGKITGGIEAVPHAHPQNGKLYIGVIHADDFKSWISILFNAIFKRDINNSPAYTLLEGKEIDIFSLHGPRRFECDGDVIEKVEHLRVIILPSSLSVLVNK